MNNAYQYNEFPVYDGITLPPFQPLMENVNSHMKSILNLSYAEGDILICGFPKSGSHWLTEIVHMLTQNTLDYAPAYETTFTIDAMDLNSSILKTLAKPRKLRSHLPFRLLPRQHLENNGKILVIRRNPKDVAVSLYNHLMKDILNLPGLRQEWSDFIVKYINGEIDLYGGWLTYEQEWDGFEKAHPDNTIHRVHYEDLKANPIENIRKIAEYLGYSYTDSTIKHVAEKCSFEKMKSGKEDITKHISVDQQPFIYRKGQVGDWKKWFTVAQNELFESKFRQRMKESRMIFRYET